MSDSFASPWTVAREAPLFLGFSRQEYWSELPFPSPGDLPDPRIKRGSPALQVVFAYTGMYPLEHILFPSFLFLILNKVLFIPLWQKKLC